MIDMLCHWRHMLENLFGPVKVVSCLGATYIPERWDEAGKPTSAPRTMRRTATFEIDGADGPIVAHFNSSWCVRVRRDDLMTFQVEGTKGTAVAGYASVGSSTLERRRSRVKPGYSEPVELLRHMAEGAGAGHIRQRVQDRVGAVSAARGEGGAIPLGSA